MAGTTTNWNNLSGNTSYFNAGNWSAGVPTSSIPGNITLDLAVVQIPEGSTIDAGLSLGSLNGVTLEAVGSMTYTGVNGSFLGPPAISTFAGISPETYTLQIDSGTFSNAANIVATGTGDTANIDIAAGATLSLTTIGSSTGSLSAVDGGVMNLLGDGVLLNDGAVSVRAPGSRLDINVPVSGSGSFTLSGTATLDLHTATGGIVYFDINPFGSPFANGATLILDMPNLHISIPKIFNFYGTVSGLFPADFSIALPNTIGNEIAPPSFAFSESGRNATVQIFRETATGPVLVAGLSFDDPKHAYTKASLTTGGFVLSESNAINGYVLTNTAVACFAQGTRILTPEGEIPVEQLQVGGKVVSAFGGAVEIVWLGHRHVAAATHADPADVWPIRIRANALAQGVPVRDVLLSPEHAVQVNDVLVPARLLVNGTSIVQEPIDAITYWHVELPQHDVVFADGLPAESYLDTGNRRAAFNVGAPPPGEDADTIWRSRACLPQLRAGTRLAAIRARLQPSTA